MIGNKKKYVKSSPKLSSWFKKKKKKLNIKAHLFYNLQVIMNSTDSGESLGLNLKENTLWHKKDVFTIISMISQCRVYRLDLHVHVHLYIQDIYHVYGSHGSRVLNFTEFPD